MKLRWRFIMIPFFFIKLMCSASPRHEHILHFCFLVGKASFSFSFNAASHIHRAQKAHLVIDSLERSCSDCWAKRRRHTAKTCSPRSKSHYHSDGNSYHSPIALDLNEVNLIFLSVWHWFSWNSSRIFRQPLSPVCGTWSPDKPWSRTAWISPGTRTFQSQIRPLNALGKE